MGLTSICSKKYLTGARGTRRTQRKLKFLFFLCGLCASVRVSSLHAAENPLSLSSEITRLEKIGASSVSSQERYDAFLALAKLYQISGNNEAALHAWDKALNINSGDGRPLLERGRLLISLGEYEKAIGSLAAIFTGNYAKDLLLEARFLFAQLEAFFYGNLRPLSALTDDTDFSEYHRIIYYTLWKIEQNPAWKALLTKDFPLSPEAKIANGASGANSKAISAQTPLWILFPGRENLDLIASTPPATPTAQLTAPAAVSGSTVLQAGLFSREENARALSDKINKAGFQSFVQTKQQNGGNYWAVYVPAGADTNAMIKKLKDAGFESFPVKVN